MNGHEDILNLRRNGFKPAYVWLQDSGLAPLDLSVTLAKTDNPEALDLRFLVGTTVLAESENIDRLGCMLRACMGAKAKRVITNLHQWSADGHRAEVIETTDTEGILSWLK